MLAPRLVAIAASLPFVPEGASLFQVEQAGTFADRQWSVGDVLVCVPTTEDTEPVVLVARGHGRPRLGMRQGHQLRGDVGELCSQARWRVAGAIVAVVRQHRGDQPGTGAPLFGAPHWHLMHRAQGGPVTAPGGVAGALRLLSDASGEEVVGPSEPDQLSLFAA